jgi:hypothetical protein
MIPVTYTCIEVRRDRKEGRTTSTLSRSNENQIRESRRDEKR